MSRVFIPQVPSRRNKETGVWVPTVDLRPARDFGEVITMLPPGSQFFAAAELTRVIRQRLWDSDFCDDDFVLALGHPAAIAATSAIAARRCNGRLSMLVWDRQTERYDVVKLDNLT